MERPISLHDQIKEGILSACIDLGYKAKQEYRGKDWRADVFVDSPTGPIAFEVQRTSQSLNRTLERQAKYDRDRVTGCWLFENITKSLSKERPELPLFNVQGTRDNGFTVSLSDRRELSLPEFLRNFIEGRIRFSQKMQAAHQQKITIAFYEMACRSCGAINHLYYVEPSFRSACNGVIRAQETLWGSGRHAHKLEIRKLVEEFLQSEAGQHLRVGEVKYRHSKTVGHAYQSFGCYGCDSIFGDWFVRDAELEVRYGRGIVLTIDRLLKLPEIAELPLPHWCFPDGQPFCDSKEFTIDTFH